VLNNNPSLRIAEAEDAVRRENGIVDTVHLRTWRDGAIRYRRTVRGGLMIQNFHRGFIDALFGRIPFR
jgi:hypothetical protein